MKKLGVAATSAYALICISLMLIIPLNKFEWMLDEPSARAEGLTFCGLPIDDDIDTRYLSLVFLAPLLMGGILQSVRQRQIHFSLWVAFALIAIWGWRFFIHYPLC